VGPRQFINLFSLTLGAGQKLKRKKNDSFERVDWSRESALPRVRMYPASYADREKAVATEVDQIIATLGHLAVKLP
jgi:hypothetical protein